MDGSVEEGVEPRGRQAAKSRTGQVLTVRCKDRACRCCGGSEARRHMGSSDACAKTSAKQASCSRKTC
jgi:hypothetical protein